MQKKYLCQCWYKHKVSDSESGSDDFFAIGCWKVFIGSFHPFNDSVKTQPFEYPGHSGSTDISQVLADIFSLHPKCHIFSTADDFQYLEVTLRKEIQPPVGTLVFYNGAGNFCEIPVPFTVVIKR